MLKFVESPFNVAGQGDINMAVFVIPVHGEAAVVLSFPIGGENVHFFEAFDEVVDMLTADVLDTEIVDSQTELYKASNMAKETGGVLGLDITVGCKVCNELVIGEFSGLGETIHALADFCLLFR